MGMFCVLSILIIWYLHIIKDENKKCHTYSGEESLAVTEHSVCYLRSGEVHAEVTMSLDYNHSEMTKLRPGDKTTYRKITSVIGEFCKNSPAVINSRFRDLHRSNPIQLLQSALGKREMGIHKTGFDFEASQSQNSQGGHCSHILKVMKPKILECLKTLAYLDMNQRRRNIKVPFSNTYQWIQKNPKYQAWRRRLNGFLWIRGKPGSGKSTIMSYIERNKDWKAHGENIITAFHFFSGKGGRVQKTEIGLLRSLLFQILSVVPPQLRRFTEIYAENRVCRNDLDFEWDLFELKDLFQQIFVDPEIPAIRVYIDALDEADGDCANNIVLFFQRLLLDPSARFSVCFSCRHFPNFGLHDTGRDILIEHENSTDIKTYIKGSLGSHVDKRIINDISEKASNVLQWVEVKIRQITLLQQQGGSERAMLNCLKSPASELNEVYRGILHSLPTKDRLESLKLFQWLSFSFRPLKVEEIRYAMVLVPLPNYGSWEKAPSFLKSDHLARLRINYLSGGLAEIFQTSDSENSQKPASLGVQLIHQSVLEFLLSEGLKFLAGGTFIIQRGHSMLAESCSTYLTAMNACQSAVKQSHSFHDGHGNYTCGHQDMELIYHNSNPGRIIRVCQACSVLKPVDKRRTTLRAGFPLLEYAVDGLLYHAMESESYFDQSHLQRLLENPNDIWKSIILLKSLFSGSNIDLSQTFYYVAANIGWWRVFERNFAIRTMDTIKHMEFWHTPNSQGRTPFWIAASKGHVDVLRTVPKKLTSWCFNCFDKNGVSLLIAALLRHHDEVVQFLLADLSVNVNEQIVRAEIP